MSLLQLLSRPPTAQSIVSILQEHLHPGTLIVVADMYAELYDDVEGAPDNFSLLEAGPDGKVYCLWNDLLENLYIERLTMEFSID